MSCVLFRMIDWNCDDWHSLVLVELVEDGKCWCEENWFHWLQIRSTRRDSCNDTHTISMSNALSTTSFVWTTLRMKKEMEEQPRINENLKWRMKEHARLEWFTYSDLKINLSNLTIFILIQFLCLRQNFSIILDNEQSRRVLTIDGNTCIIMFFRTKQWKAQCWSLHARVKIKKIKLHSLLDQIDDW